MTYDVTFKPLSPNDRYNTGRFKNVKIGYDDNYVYLTSEMTNEIVFIAPRESIYYVKEPG